MASKVYFADFRARTEKENKIQKIKRLFDALDLSNIISDGDLTAIKIHFGEQGGDSFINPIFVKPVSDKIKEAGGKPFVTDTNTLYSGSRHNAVDHLMTTIEHGFSYSVTGAPVIISDGLKSENFIDVEIEGKHFKSAKIAGDIVNADSMIVMSHFKGHGMAGFGGSIKNLAMGCACAEGKKDQHSLRPVVNTKKCAACGKCIEICPQNAVSMVDGKAHIDKELCVGCAECIAMCEFNSIKLDWSVELEEFTEKLTEYALGAIKGKENKVAYINFLINITPDCDCVPWSDTPIVPNIGMLVSFDPVAIDKASLDLVNEQKPIINSYLDDSEHEDCDHFKRMWKDTKGDIQISYGTEIGLGSSEYELVKI
ncbi:DUF362 domain-containing protein [Abyssisolibacter fermentans]|uniref:DUF362 domain-containing protein n=1 Tax=Abyssisolibacter fermentans TaxID=1766203 RepID=UPI00082DF353|nr:DUF362 domain-containing protein [Abyssisolibacter fermentans]